MSADSSTTNLQFAEIEKMLAGMYGNDTFKKEENEQMDTKLRELILLLEEAFAPSIGRLVPKATGPSLALLRESEGIVSPKNETLPLRQQFLDLWTEIGHLSHRLDLDEIISGNPDIKRLAGEVASLLQLHRETELPKSKPVDLNALRERLNRNPK